MQSNYVNISVSISWLCTFSKPKHIVLMILIDLRGQRHYVMKITTIIYLAWHSVVSLADSGGPDWHIETVFLSLSVRVMYSKSLHTPVSYPHRVLIFQHNIITSTCCSAWRSLITVIKNPSLQIPMLKFAGFAFFSIWLLLLQPANTHKEILTCC